jgi:hypothetical protein
VMAVSLTSTLLCWEHRIWRHGVEVPSCPPPVRVAVRGFSLGAQCTPLSVSPRRYLLGADQVPPSVSFRWCIHKESSLELLFFGDVALLYSLGHALSCCVCFIDVTVFRLAGGELLLHSLLTANGSVLVFKALLYKNMVRL